jgi:hypothetical protein
MWIVHLALRQPYTFVVAALLLPLSSDYRAYYCLRPDAISSGQVCHVSFVLRFQLAETSAPQRMAQMKTPLVRVLAGGRQN